MSEINTEYLQRCIDTLEKSYQMLNNAEEGTIDYELYRNSLVKSFEMTIEQSGKLLKKKIIPYFSSKRAVDVLTFKDIFRNAHKFGLITEDETVRWMKYRDNYNNTIHDYEQEFAEDTLNLTDSFLFDAQNLEEMISRINTER